MAHNADSRKIQDNIIQSIKTVVRSEIGSTNTTNSVIGIVIEDPKNYRVKVKINDDIFEATVPEERHHWIQKDDVVIIQDLYNDRQKLVVIGKTGHTQNSQGAQMVFADHRDTDNYVSGVDGLFDAQGENVGYSIVPTEAFGRSIGRREYVYEFENASEWTLNHSLERAYPNIVLVDGNGILIQASQVQYMDDRNIKITFSSEKTGKAILS